MVTETWTPEETYAFGRRLGEAAEPSSVYCLNGDLGVGKTVFTQGFADGLGVEGPVDSPTFTIVKQYDDGRMPFYHLMCTGSAISAKWMRSAMRTVFTETESAWWNGAA